MEDKIFDIVTDLIRDDISKEEAIDKLLILYNVSVSLPLVEVDKDILKICIDAYNNGEKLTAIKVLKEEAKNKLYSFGLKDAEQFLKGYER